MTFNCYANAGNGDSTDWEMDFAISPEEEHLIIKNIKAGKDEFSSIIELNDLYNRVYDEMLNEQVSVYRDLEEDGELPEIAKENNLDNIYDVTNEMIQNYLEDRYCFGIAFSLELIEKYQE